MAIRRAQECVELSLKAALRAISLEYPREHDVGKALELVKGKFPDWFSLQTSEFMKISRDLAKKRGPAFYGFETEIKPASDIFTRGDAEEALVSAEEVFQNCQKTNTGTFS